MIRLYSGSASNEINRDGPVLAKHHWEGMRATAVHFLRAQGWLQAADTLATTSFDLFEAQNGFGDDFNVLYWHAPMDAYVRRLSKAALCQTSNPPRNRPNINGYRLQIIIGSVVIV